MKAVIVSCLAFGGMAFAQSSLPELPRFSMHAYQFAMPRVQTGKAFGYAAIIPNGSKPVLVQVTIPSACAIPLLNALPAQDKTDYKVQTIKPSVSELPGGQAVGLPACPATSR